MDREDKGQTKIEKDNAGDASTGQGQGPSGKDHRPGNVSSDHANIPSGEDHRSGDAPSHNEEGPSGQDLPSRGSATERASVLSNDKSGLKVKLFERGSPITISVPSDVAAKAAASGLNVNVGAIVRVPVFKNLGKVHSIFSDM